jgi:hypothetical protein
MIDSEDVSNKQVCFIRYYSVISFYYRVDLCLKKVLVDVIRVLWLFCQVVFLDLFQVHDLHIQ